MRILLTSACYLPTTNGVSHHLSLLRQALESTGHQTLLVVPRHPQRKSHPTIYPLQSLPNLLAPNYPLALPILNYSRIKTFAPDIIHTHHPFIIGALSQQLSSKCNVPLIFTHHTQYHQYAESYFPPPISSLLRIAINKHVADFISHTQAVIAPQPLLYRQLAVTFEKKVHYIPNSIDLNHFNNLPTRTQHLSLIYVGRLDKEKDPLNLIFFMKSLVKIVPTASLSLVGDGNQTQLIRQNITRLHLENNIRLLGQRPRSSIATLLPRHHFFISFSATETMPLSFIEAQACGLPLIILPKLKKSLHHMIALPHQQSFAATAKKIISIWKNPTLYTKYSQSSSKAAQFFDLQKTTPKILNLYRRTIANHIRKM